MSFVLTSFLEADALCKGVNHTWSLALTLAPERQRNKQFYMRSGDLKEQKCCRVNWQ